MEAKEPKIEPLPPIVTKETLADSLEYNTGNTVENIKANSEGTPQRVKSLEEYANDLISRSELAVIDFSDDTKANAPTIGKYKIEKTGNPFIDSQIKILNKFGISNSDFEDLVNNVVWDLAEDHLKEDITKLQKLAGMKDADCDGILGPQTAAALEIYAKHLEHLGSGIAVFRDGYEKRLNAIHRIYEKMKPSIKMVDKAGNA